MKRKQIENSITRLWGALVIIKAGWTCQRCGTGADVINPHHIIPRGFKRLLGDIDNGLALCQHGCHRSAHDYPKEFKQWLEDNHGELLTRLQEIKNKGVKRHTIFELQEIDRELQKEHKRLGEDPIQF